MHESFDLRFHAHTHTRARAHIHTRARAQDEVVQLTEEILKLREKSERFETVFARLKREGVAVPDDVVQRSSPPLSPARGASRGMIRLQRADVGRLVKDLVTHLDPATLDKQIPGFAAHVLFMCVLYADNENDEALVQDLLVQIIRGIKGVTMQKAANLRFLAFWMATTYALVNAMRMCSGEKEYRPSGKAPVLENFDFSECVVLSLAHKIDAHLAKPPLLFFVLTSSASSHCVYYLVFFTCTLFSLLILITRALRCLPATLSRFYLALHHGRSHLTTTLLASPSSFPCLFRTPRYRKILTDVLVQIYQTVIRHIENA